MKDAGDGSQPEQQSGNQKESRNHVAAGTLDPDVGDNRKRSLLGHQHESRNQVATETLDPEVGDNGKRSLLGHHQVASADDNEKPAPERAGSSTDPERVPCIPEPSARGRASRALVELPIASSSAAVGDHG